MLNTARAIAAQRKAGSGEVAEEGFTLIELLVVLLIIGILLAIAIPTFLSVTQSANNTAAQANLQTALTAAKAYNTQNNQSYTHLGTAAFNSVDTGLSVITNASGTIVSKSHNVQFVTELNGQEVVIVAFAPGSNDCWALADSEAANVPIITGKAQQAPGQSYGVLKNAVGGANCTAAGAYAGTGWNFQTNNFPAG